MQKKLDENYHQFYFINLMTKQNSITIPIFPLSGVIMFPGSILPLNIFEPRYLNMVNDTLKTNSRFIGIIQPLTEDDKNLKSYHNIIGCYGKIVKFEETEKNTILISLKGISRFSVIDCKPAMGGYINSKISEKDFKDDVSNEDNSLFKFEKDIRLKNVLKSYLKLKSLESNWEYIDSCSNKDLVNQLSMICPFSSHEKQMLLESNFIEDRYILLISILENTVVRNEQKDKTQH